MDLLYFLFLGLAFLTIVMLLEGLFLAWNARRGPQARRLQHRLQTLSAGGSQIVQPTLVKKRLLSDAPALERLLLAVPRIHALDRFLVQSAMDISVATFLGFAGAAFVAGLVVPAALGLPLPVSLACAVLLLAAWVGYVQRQRLRRMTLIDQQLPDALDLMARAMQAGHAFSSALRLVGTEGPHPIAEEFQTTFDEMNFGISTERALAHLAGRVGSSDLRFFVVAVVVQRDSGGDLAGILTSIAALVRERQRLMGSVRVLSAEARISAWILSVLPFVLAGVISLINIKFIARLWTDPMGQRMAGVALALMVLGIWWMWRLVKIRV